MAGKSTIAASLAIAAVDQWAFIGFILNHPEPFTNLPPLNKPASASNPIARQPLGKVVRGGISSLPSSKVHFSKATEERNAEDSQIDEHPVASDAVFPFPLPASRGSLSGVDPVRMALRDAYGRLAPSFQLRLMRHNSR